MNGPPGDEEIRPTRGGTDLEIGREATTSVGQQLDAELGLVGAVMGARAADIGKFVHALDPQAFLNPVCKFVWRVLRSTAAAGVDADPIIVLNAARDAGMTPPPGWRGQPLSALQSIACNAPPPAAIGYYLQIVRENFERRRIRAMAARIVAVAHSAPLDELRQLCSELAA